MLWLIVLFTVVQGVDINPKAVLLEVITLVFLNVPIVTKNTAIAVQAQMAADNAQIVGVIPTELLAQLIQARKHQTIMRHIQR